MLCWCENNLPQRKWFILLTSEAENIPNKKSHLSSVHVPTEALGMVNIKKEGKQHSHCWELNTLKVEKKAFFCLCILNVSKICFKKKAKFRKDFWSAYKDHKERDKYFLKALKEEMLFCIGITQKTPVSTNHIVVRALHKAIKLNRREN